ncbi:outer membrane protein assembly factor BamA [bacterium]|nr:outer membrane protein assembly factor BamA [candidate division CSSED10-310 bacterium]
MLFSLLVLLVIGPYLAIAGAAVPPEVAQEIVFEGYANVELETIDFLVKLSVGSPLDQVTIRRDIKSLYATGMFDDICVSAEPLTEGYRVTYTVKERPIISDIAITGADAVALNTLRDELTIKNSDRYDPVKVRESVSLMQQKYREKGYNFVTISPRLTASQPGIAALVFDIDEGSQLRINRIRIEGNDALSAGNRFWGIKSQFKENQEWWWLSFITDSGVFREELLHDDIRAIEKFYKDRGYLRVAVSEPKLTLNPTETPSESATLDMTVHIDEGPIYTLGDVGVRVTDETILAQADALRVVTSTRLESYQKYLGGSAFFKAGPRFETGKRYSMALEEQAVTNLSDLYGAMGYIYVYIEPERVIDDVNHVVNITFNIVEGMQAFLHRLEFKGNNRTRDRVLRRNFAITEGDVFNTALVKTSIARINYLPYIDEVMPEIVPQVDPSQVDVLISLADNRQTEIQLAGGYSGYNELYGTVGLSEHNLFGRGQEINVSATVGKRSESFRFAFIDEWIMDRPYYGSMGIWNTKEEYDYSDQKKRGGSIVGGRSFGRGFSTRLGYTYERNTVYNVSENADDDVKDLEGTQITSSLTSTWIYTSLNDKLDPSTGFYASASVELAGDFLGGENDFYKARMNITRYWSLPRRLIFSLKGELNVADGMNGDDLPFYERFRLGGPHSIRGYEDYSVGPVDEYGQSLGGNKAVEVSAELQVPIAQPLKLVFFLDAGDSWAAEDHIDIRSLRPSTGFEVRFFMPGFGIPLRFIWGYNLDPYENENRNDFQFTMGTSF